MNAVWVAASDQVHDTLPKRQQLQIALLIGPRATGYPSNRTQHIFSLHLLRKVIVVEPLIALWVFRFVLYVFIVLEAVENGPARW